MTGFHCGPPKTTVTAATPHLVIPTPGLTAVSGVAWLKTALPERLIQEFFLLDPDNAAAIAAATGVKEDAVRAAMTTSASYEGLGILPSGAGAAWQANPWTWQRNPWHPLLLTYQADYYPIDYGTPASPNWTFSKGEYSWNGHPDAVGTPRQVSGVIQLTPAAVFNMKSRIQSFLDNHPHLDPKIRQEFLDLLNFVQTKDSWDLLSQSLDGFDQQLLLNMTGVFLGTASTSVGTAPLDPTWAIRDHIGPAHGDPPRLGSIPLSAPYDPSPFLPWRAGQFVLTDVKVVDEWGQALWPINATNYKVDNIYLPPEMMANPPVIPGMTGNFVQLTPGSSNPAVWISIDLRPTNHDNSAGLAPDADPISGWVLVNHLDGSLMTYDAQGQPLGEMSMGITDTDSPISAGWMRRGRPTTVSTTSSSGSNTSGHFCGRCGSRDRPPSPRSSPQSTRRSGPRCPWPPVWIRAWRH